jgi:hypothetical protein
MSVLDEPRLLIIVDVASRSWVGAFRPLSWDLPELECALELFLLWEHDGPQIPRLIRFNIGMSTKSWVTEDGSWLPGTAVIMGLVWVHGPPHSQLLQSVGEKWQGKGTGAAAGSLWWRALLGSVSTFKKRQPVAVDFLFEWDEVAVWGCYLDVASSNMVPPGLVEMFKGWALD